MKKLIICAVAALAACKGDPIYRDRPVTVNVPVVQPCATPRPAGVEPLQDQYTRAEWDQLDPRQKAAAVGRQGFDHLAYGQDLNAATGACPEVTTPQEGQ